MSSRSNPMPPKAERITSPMTKAAILIYGVACYLIFLATFAYMIAFTGNLFIVRSIDADSTLPSMQALATDLGLIALFGVQHTVMAQEAFKKWWTRIVPQPMERSTFVLTSSGLLLLLAWQWQPMPGTIWQIENPIGRVALQALFWIGWLIVLVSTFLIDHFDLFGLRQVYWHWREIEYRAPDFQAPFLYQVVRHPIMLGLLIAFWATPQMSVGHLVFAAGMTCYIFIGTTMEERALVRHFGDRYRDYQHKTSMLIPFSIRQQPNDRGREE